MFMLADLLSTLCEVTDGRYRRICWEIHTPDATVKVSRCSTLTIPLASYAEHVDDVCVFFQSYLRYLTCIHI